MDMEQESAEKSAWEQVMQLCQTGGPSALQKIGEIAQSQIAGQEQEMAGGEEGGEAAPAPDMASRVMDRLQKNKGA
jgi:hypothetical protein